MENRIGKKLKHVGVGALVVALSLILMGSMPAWAEDSRQTVTFHQGAGLTYTLVVHTGEAVGEKNWPIDPVPAAEGHQFGGWFTEEDGGVSWQPEDTVAEDLRLYGRWVSAETGETVDAPGEETTPEGPYITILDEQVTLATPDGLMDSQDGEASAGVTNPDTGAGTLVYPMMGLLVTSGIVMVSSKRRR